ncbi:zinc finger protein 692-like isoform X2 [Mixophyes fleayi]|uniref:zinc finger protein 692-like isoform X2 n=1 Tax=Mixophyes fleayi TaxID=3061075 RepID=UPI003F4D83F1
MALLHSSKLRVEAARREKRRLLDAQRGKCRVRLGAHLEEWCVLKDHLGFSLHSQLAKFLLDSYRTTASSGTSVPKVITQLSVSPASLHRLAFSCHQHGRNCVSPPIILSPPHSDEAPEPPVLFWGCREDHYFHWDPSDSTTEIETMLAVTTSNGKIQESPSTVEDKTKEQEKVPVINTEESPVKSKKIQPEATARHKVIMQTPEIEPDNIVIQERITERQPESDITVNRCPENVNAQVELSDDVEGMSENFNINMELTENITEEMLQKTSGKNSEPLNTTIFEKRVECIIDYKGLYHSGGHEKIQHSASEDRDPMDEETSPQSVGDAEGTQKSTSIVRRKPDLLHSGRAGKHQRDNLQVSESNIQAITGEPKTELSLPCRRSSRGSIGYRMKADKMEQVSRSGAQFIGVCKVVDETHGCDIETPLGAKQNIETSTEICLIQESIAEEGIEQKTSSEDLEWRKPRIDEELAQICKKRIRKATPLELLMCEFDDCGKIFSKRQYLNYHQKYQHMYQRMFRCSVSECGKTFNFKKHLKEHEKRHSDRRDFICEFCARAFRSSSNLIIHRRIHTGEKPLQCEFCGFTCRQKASLNWHMKKHNVDSLYNFPCDICSQRFEKRDNLAAHRSRKHPASQVTVISCTTHCNTPSIENVCETEASCKADCPEREEIVQTPPESVRETLFPEYLDLTENVQGAPQPPAQVSGNSEISLVIVL